MSLGTWVWGLDCYCLRCVSGFGLLVYGCGGFVGFCVCGLIASVRVVLGVLFAFGFVLSRF